MKVKKKKNSKRYVIVNKENEVVDDAQGYGFKSREKALKAMHYKFNGEKERRWGKKKKEVYFLDKTYEFNGWCFISSG